MFNDLKELHIGEMISIDGKKVNKLTGNQDFTVSNIRLYSQEEGEIIFIDLENFYLVGHTFEGFPNYFFYEENDDLYEIFKNDEFSPKIKTYKNNKMFVYKIVTEPFYNLIPELPLDEDVCEISCCEYISNSKFLSHVLIEKIDTNLTLYHGFKINKTNILI